MRTHGDARNADLRVIGGLHLAGMGEGLTRQTVEAMREYQLRVIGTGH